MCLIFATPCWSPHVWTSPPIHLQKGGLQDEEEFPILRKGGEKCFSHALSSSGSQCWSERSKHLSLQLMGDRRKETTAGMSRHYSNAFSCCFLRQVVKSRTRQNEEACSRAYSSAGDTHLLRGQHYSSSR